MKISTDFYTPKQQSEIDSYFVIELADVLANNCFSYRDVLEAIAPFPNHKAAAWALLPREEKARIHALKRASVVGSAA